MAVAEDAVQETGDTDGADRPESSTFHQPFGISQPHPLCLCLGTLFEFGLDFFDQGYCFWCANLKRGVHVRALPKTAFQQASPISEEGNLKSAPWSARCALSGHCLLLHREFGPQAGEIAIDRGHREHPAPALVAQQAIFRRDVAVD
jgi:hypothetical protein